MKTRRQRREVRAYETLLRRSDVLVAPRLLGAEPTGSTTAYLYLEWMAPSLRWPWRESWLAALVLERLADVHACLPVGVRRWLEPCTG